ncbi:MAG: hypothetical protein JXC31_05825 [Acholeplasmataceae bacterium]|nr:hypothetical protein [Acholeplasmataceae bacterium]
MKKYKVLERDVVVEGIYCDYVFNKEERMYYLMSSYNGKYVTMLLGNDKDKSQTAFYFFSMEFCAMYDTYDKKAFVEHVGKYSDVRSIKRIKMSNFDEKIDSINIY